MGFLALTLSIIAGASEGSTSTIFGADPHLDLTEAVAAAGTYQVYVTAVNHNVVRISGGALGFPVL